MTTKRKRLATREILEYVIKCADEMPHGCHFTNRFVAELAKELLELREAKHD